MFYIKEPILAKREKFFSPVLPAMIVLIAFACLSALSWLNARQNVKNEQTTVIEQRMLDTSTTLTQRLIIYENALYGGAGLFSASDSVSRAAWKQYVESINLQDRYPGFQGLGYSQIIMPSEKDQHERVIRQQGVADYSIFPEGDRQIYTSIVYIEPMNQRNQNAIGYDMYTNSARSKAMDQAALRGQAAMSQLVTLVQEENETNKQPGFLIYVPVYKKDSVNETREQRRSNITGFVYAPFRTHDLIDTVVDKSEPFYGFRITEKSTQREIYSTQNYDRLISSDSSNSNVKEIEIAGAVWRIQGVTSPEAVNYNVRGRPDAVLWGGILFSSLVAGFIYLLFLNRTRSLAQKEEAGIQEAKDELLALASHQLRTPATGVKQYIGMLREGFAGTLTDEQTSLVEKAYASNERQLNTINEILFIAKADAGQLKMNFERLNLTELLKEIIDEQRAIIATRQQILHTTIPKTEIYIHADRHYIRMAIENLVSNATKYTHESGTVSVELRSDTSSCFVIVTDTGVGVNKADQRLLFKKFSRVPNELTSKVAGSGIGLYLAKKITEAHSGNIMFKSEPRKGSQVTLMLPKIRKNT